MQKIMAEKKVAQATPVPSALTKAVEAISEDARIEPRQMVINFVTPEGGE